MIHIKFLNKELGKISNYCMQTSRFKISLDFSYIEISCITVPRMSNSIRIEDTEVN